MFYSKLPSSAYSYANSPVVTTFEHAIVGIQDFADRRDFDWLIHQNIHGLTVQFRAGKAFLKVGHYLGVIGLPSGKQLEVLPKISAQSQLSLIETRRWVQTMLLQTWQGLNQKPLALLSDQAATLLHPKQPISTWLIAYFYELLTQYRPNRHYQTNAQNQDFLQGKLLIKEQVYYNSHQPHKFFSQKDQLEYDTACNRLIKRAYVHLNHCHHFS